MTNGYFNNKFWPKASTGDDSYFNDLYFGHFGAGVSGFIYVKVNKSAKTTTISSVSSETTTIFNAGSKTTAIKNTSLG